MTSKPRRRLRDRRDYLAYAAVGGAIGAALVLGEGRVSPAVSGSAVALVTLGAGVFACRRGGRVDEFSLSAVKFAWLWGGFAGMALGMGLAIWALLTGQGVALDLPRFSADEARAFAGGIALVIALQLVLYLVVLAAFWRRAAR
jgi:hypothetical protein